MKLLTLLFLVRDDEILLAMKKRGVGAGKWNGAGGKVEANESIEQAMVRETQEEICVTPMAYEKVAVHAFEFADGAVGETHTFLCTKWNGSPKETEEMAPKWFKQSEIPYDEMWQDDIVWLPLVLQGKKLKTHFHFDIHDNMTAAELKIVENVE